MHQCRDGVCDMGRVQGADMTASSVHAPPCAGQQTALDNAVCDVATLEWTERPIHIWAGPWHKVGACRDQYAIVASRDVRDLLWNREPWTKDLGRAHEPRAETWVVAAERRLSSVCLSLQLYLARHRQCRRTARPSRDAARSPPARSPRVSPDSALRAGLRLRVESNHECARAARR